MSPSAECWQTEVTRPYIVTNNVLQGEYKNKPIKSQHGKRNQFETQVLVVVLLIGLEISRKGTELNMTKDLE